jgi:hypothetical protein
MSKLVERLKDLDKGIVGTIGFRQGGAETTTPAPLLIMTRLMAINQGSSVVLANNAEAGIDAAVLPAKGQAPNDLKPLVGALGGVPAGIVLDSLQGRAAEHLLTCGADFVVFNLQTAAVVVDTKNAGKVLDLNYETDPEVLRAASELAGKVDAIMLTGNKAAYVTTDQLITCRRLVKMFDRPLVIEVNSAITAAELLLLWEAGVDGIVVSEALSVKAVQDLKKLAATLPKGGRKPWDKAQRKDTVAAIGLARQSEGEGPHKEEDGEEGE